MSASLPQQGRVSKFLSLPLSEQFLFVQAWCLLGRARLGILTVSFKRLVRHLQHHREMMDDPPLAPGQLETARRIGQLVATAARHTPWQSLCLAQVLVAQRLLARHGIPGQFFLGVAKDMGDSVDRPQMEAHAWLGCGGVIVNGAPGHEAYTVVSAFSWE